MSKIALIVRHKAKSGRRDELRAVWERFIKPNVLQNPEHLAYYFNYDQDDQDVVIAFQIFSSVQAKDEFLKSEWYPEYIRQVSDYIVDPPNITTASLLWSKNDEETEDGREN